MKNLSISIFSIILFFGFLNGQEIKPYRLGIIVNDLELSTSWYTETFNVDVYEKFSYPKDDVRVHLLKNDELEFELVERKTSFSIFELLPNYDNRERPVEGFYKASFEVENIQVLYDKLLQEEAEIYFPLTTDDELGIKTFIIKDPDKNLLQFVEIIEE